ncbi:MAG: FHA domain-containing protein [Ignavibacteria bacterium]|nr:FHA domain-containing protein [Ignavibacteria bacterium]
MKQCPKCRGNNNDQAKFCADCGAPMQAGGSMPSSGSKLITIGRNPQNTLKLEGSGISNFHCELEINGGTCTIRDKNSTNGIYINGKRVSTATLQKGDVVTLGKSHILDWQNFVNSGGYIPPAKSALGNSGKKEYFIGRNPDCDRVIDNIKVSRRHCRLYQEGDSWFVEDLGSSNGTFLNGQKIQKSPVNASDTLTVGGIPLSLESIVSGSRVSLGETAISAHHLVYYGGERKLIDDISLNIAPGQFVGLIGDSGAGKTTLMYLLCGINRPYSGDVKINGESIIAYPDLFKGQFGYVPQDDILHRELKIIESLEYTGRLRLGHKLDSGDISDKAYDVLKKLNLKGKEDVTIGSPEKKGASGGQRKRVNLGQELMTDPGFLVLDEPTSGLDPLSDREVMQILRKSADNGQTVLLTTHNISVTNFKFLTHVIVLAQEGKLAYYGPADEACSYFGVDDPVYIFDALKKKTPEEWKAAYRKSKYFQNFSNNDASSKSYSSMKSPSLNTDFFNQFTTLVSRYFTVTIRDYERLGLMLFIAPVIALLINMLFSGDGAEVKAIFILVISTIWLGCSNAVREIVNERSIYKRERMVNLSIPAYLSSKMAVLLLFSLYQIFCLVGITSMKFDYSNQVGLFLILFYTSIIATILGLLISAVSRTEAFALTVLPLVLIPMVIFAGLVQVYKEMAGWIQGFSGIWLSRWAYELSLSNSFSDGVGIIGFNSDGSVVAYGIMTTMLFLFLGGLVWMLKSLDKKK